MTRSPAGRASYGGATVLVGAILAGTLLYLVPTLVLTGAVTMAVVVAVVVAVGVGALLLLHRRQLDAVDRALAHERLAAARYRRLLDLATEGFVVLDASGELLHASGSAARLAGGDVESLESNGGLLGLLRPAERTAVARRFARLRRQAGASFTMEVSVTGDGERETSLELRAVNLLDDPRIGGIFIGLRDITLRKTFETEIQHLAYYDALTGLANRRFFFEHGERVLTLARRRGHPAGVLYLDVDGFKEVNDVLGHEAGDGLLEDVAEALRRCLRDSDIVARLGGDEFGVVLSEVRDVEAAGRVAHRILDRLPTMVFGDGREVPVSASIGLALFPDDGEGLEPLLKAADLAMYRAKTDGLGVQFYRPELRELLSDRMRLEKDMRRALERHEFQLHYQPVFHLATGAMVGAEALSRWRHFSRGMVATAEFIELAETSGLIRSLDRWAVARAVHQRVTSLDGRFAGWIAVNLSPQSMTDPELPGYIRQVLEQNRLEPGALVLEISDAAVGIDPVAAADLMWELKNTGAAIALDDFGAGRISFAQLRALPIDILKLDADLIRPIGQGEADERLVEGAMAIARGVRAKVLAKGVERSAQVDWLRDAGCDFVQGYLMGAPVPAEELTTPARQSPPA